MILIGLRLVHTYVASISASTSTSTRKSTCEPWRCRHKLLASPRFTRTFSCAYTCACTYGCVVRVNQPWQTMERWPKFVPQYCTSNFWSVFKAKPNLQKMNLGENFKFPASVDHASLSFGVKKIQERELLTSLARPVRRRYRTSVLAVRVKCKRSRLIERTIIQ